MASSSSKNYGTTSAVRSNLSNADKVLRGLETSSDSPGSPLQLRAKQNLPQRSTKISQKLVLFPEKEPASQRTAIIPTSPDVGADEFLLPLPVDLGTGIQSEAERLSKEARDRAKIPRVTAYCVAEGYQLDRIREFLKKQHQVLQPRLYDECLYAPYNFPLLPGPGTTGSNIIRRIGAQPIIGTARVISSPFIKSPGGSSVLDKQLTQEEDVEFALSYEDVSFSRQIPALSNIISHNVIHEDEPTSTTIQEEISNGSHLEEVLSKKKLPRRPPPAVPAPFMGGEVFIFDYGVVLLWNFTEVEEKAILEDLAPFRIRPMEKDDVQVESMHFQYDIEQNQPRIYNDMITLRSGNHMIKLTISHALSQSAVLAQYEDMMDNTIETTKHIPKSLATTGNLHMSRMEITKSSGRLFKLRMNVNLVSNVLDTPEIFWSEPSLGPHYEAMRGYLEITQRSRILNDRCSVLSDLLDMLRDDMNSNYMSWLNWIVIWLIVMAILVAMGEIAVKSLNHVSGKE